MAFCMYRRRTFPPNLSGANLSGAHGMRTGSTGVKRAPAQVEKVVHDFREYPESIRTATDLC